MPFFGSWGQDSSGHFIEPVSCAEHSTAGTDRKNGRLYRCDRISVPFSISEVLCSSNARSRLTFTFLWRRQQPQEVSVDLFLGLRSLIDRNSQLVLRTIGR